MTKRTENPCNEATFIGNRMVGSLDLIGPDKKSLREKYLIGDPRQCAAGSAEEMKRRGYVGIYMKERVVRFRIPQSGLVLQQSW
ncbi:MAG: hypothetical protein ABJC04_04830 [Verrucomicrobiota bacterium]